MADIEFLSESVFRTPFYVSSLNHSKNKRLTFTKEHAYEGYENFLSIRAALMEMGFLTPDRDDSNMKFEVWGEDRRQISKQTTMALAQVPSELARTVRRVVRRVPFFSPAFLKFVEKDDTYNGKWDKQLMQLRTYGRTYEQDKTYDCYHLAYGSFDVLRSVVSPLAYYKTSMGQRVLTRDKFFSQYMEKFLDTPAGANRELSYREFQAYMALLAEEVKEQAEKFGYDIPLEKMPKVIPLILAFTRSHQLFGDKCLLENDMNYHRAMDTLFKIIVSDMPVEIAMIWLSASNYALDDIRKRKPDTPFVMEFEELLDFSNLPVNSIRDILSINEKAERENIIKQLSSLV